MPIKYISINQLNQYLSVSLCEAQGYSLRKVLYAPKGFFEHAVSLDQAFAHCPRFSTAATRRCEARISVPLLGITLSRPLPVIALVGHYPTNKLMGRNPPFNRKTKLTFTLRLLSGTIGN